MDKYSKEKPADTNPLIYNIVIPLALSITGIVIAVLVRKSRSRMDSPETMSQYEFEEEEDDDEETEDDDEDETEEGEDDDDDDDDDNDQEGNKKESITVILNRPLESTSTQEIPIHECNEGSSNTVEEIEGVRCSVASLEERTNLLESQFYDYCNMKEQESAFQKLQIMCLGLKLELIESQNRRLEDTIGEFKQAMEQVEVIRSENKLLQREVKKLSKADRECGNLIRQHAPKFVEMKDEIMRSNQQFLQATKEIKQVGDQLLEEIKVIEDKLERNTSKQTEILVEESSTILENKKLFEHLQQLCNQKQLCNQWSAEMEELIYIGWINACLRREVLIIQDEERDQGNNNDLVELGEKPAQDLGDKVILDLRVDNEHVRHCSIESSVADIEDICVDLTAKSPSRGLKKQRLLHKIKGWAKGKGGCKGAYACDKGKSLESMLSSNCEDY